MNPPPKNPISRNEAFRCEYCKKENPKAPKTCRNHCKYCLYSKHVDAEIPGDRQSICHGLMEPEQIVYQAKKGFQIVHRCRRCGEEKINKAAEDDSQEMLTTIMQKQNTLLTAYPLEVKKNERKSSRHH